MPKSRPKKSARRTPTYPALLITQNRHRFYFATIPVDDLFRHCFVARRDEDSKAGFQRVLNEGRADDIARYLASGSGSIPTNIVLSAQPSAQFEYSRKSKSISFDRVDHAFLVLDGQHRLWGYSKCKVRHRVPVAIYEGIARTEEARLFIDINTNQRGVPAALLLDIKKIAQIESEKESQLRSLFDRLSKDSKSPLAGKLSASKSVAGKISRVTFNRALQPALGSQVVVEMESSDIYQLLLNYLNAFEAELPGEKLLFRAAFFEAIFELFDEIVRATLNVQGNARQESIQQTIRPLANVDYSTAAAGRASVTKKALTNLMLSSLRSSLRISKEML
jgi:DGQHR domain-containing protein